MEPETGYARSDGRSIAYQVVGNGPLDLVFFPEWFNNLEAQWDDPRLAAFATRLASFARVIMLNQRGMGLSDPIPIGDSITAEDWIEDARTAMDVVGVEQTALLGTGTGGTVALLFAASILGVSRRLCSSTAPPGRQPLTTTHSAARQSYAQECGI